MRKYLLICALALVAAACNPFRTDTYSFDECLVSRPDSLSMLTMSISLEYPVKGFPKEVIDTMCSTILMNAFDLEETSGSVDATADVYVSYVKEAYLNEAPEENPYTVEDEVNGYFSGQYGNYRTYIVEYYTYTGGAHGLNTYTPLVFDTGTGLVVPEEDFFADGYKEPVSGMIREKLLEENEDIPLFDLFAVGANGAYELSENGVSWYFQPYEIAPYAYGVLSVTLPWDKVKPFIRKI